MKRVRGLVGVAVLVTTTMCGQMWAQGNFGPQPQLSAKEVYLVKPTAADPGLKTTEDDDNVVMLPKGTPRPELFLWIPGTNGHPSGDSAILETAVQGGYRVIGLQYNDKGTAENFCKNSDEECFTRIRKERFQGGVENAPSVNSVDEGIEHRLTMLLKYIVAKHPDEGWGQYLDGDKIAWNKLVVAGHSQGAGMAGYIAKHHELARVVLFSGGADGVGFTPETRKWASWLTMTSATPVDRWYAEYNAKEAIAFAQPMDYQDELKIPADHILIFKLDLPQGGKQGPGLAAHMSVVHDMRYQPQWLWMLGISDKKPAA